MTSPVEAARAALRLGGEIQSVACQYTVSINGVPVGVVSASEHAELQALAAKLKLEAAAHGDTSNLRMLSKSHLADLGRDLGLTVEGMTKNELITELVAKGFSL